MLSNHSLAQPGKNSKRVGINLIFNINQLPEEEVFG
jgi:hypothetical protein